MIDSNEPEALKSLNFEAKLQILKEALELIRDACPSKFGNGIQWKLRCEVNSGIARRALEDIE